MEADAVNCDRVQRRLEFVGAVVTMTIASTGVIAPHKRLRWTSCLNGGCRG